MMYLGCYDIENDRLRQKVAERLLAAGLDRVQYSVFIGPLTDVARRHLLLSVEKMLLGQERTHFMLLPILADSVSEYLYVGSSAPNWEYLTGKAKTLIF